ncbi:hypothetical protein [Pseudooceanicola batsensis]|uniref:hypothetical protein n=1 Tax=Pseudooceanicola batsensis TaxID=314255 RepID=UPI0003242887|nr:hypothetical protein [Pseudooceanicola batsensis]
MRLVPTPVACELTGLSTEKLREWTSRRALVSVDVRPRCKGAPAKFGWQTILVLRIAVLLREQFSMELQTHKASFALLREELRNRSFISLWGQRLGLASDGNWTFLESNETVCGADVLLMELDRHLAILRDGFALPDANHAQMDLFSLPATRGVHEDRASFVPSTSYQRRSA